MPDFVAYLISFCFIGLSGGLLAALTLLWPMDNVDKKLSAALCVLIALAGVLLGVAFAPVSLAGWVMAAFLTPGIPGVYIWFFWLPKQTA